MIPLLEPKIETIDGKDFTLSKFPAVQGREIISQYSTSIVPKIGDYKVNQEMMLKLMNYVAVSDLRLSTIELINNHVASWETLAKIEIAMMGYNCSFFHDGRFSSLLNDTAQKVPQWVSKILTALSQQSLQMEKPPLTS